MDIHNSSRVVRDADTVRARVQSGNSGGPLLDESGQVCGAAVDDAETGFALTGEGIADDIAEAPNLTTRSTPAFAQPDDSSASPAVGSRDKVLR